MWAEGQIRRLEAFQIFFKQTLNARLYLILETFYYFIYFLINKRCAQGGSNANLNFLPCTRFQTEKKKKKEKKGEGKNITINITLNLLILAAKIYKIPK